VHSETAEKMLTNKINYRFWHYLKRFVTSDDILKTKHVTMCILTLVEAITNCRQT